MVSAAMGRSSFVVAVMAVAERWRRRPSGSEHHSTMGRTSFPNESWAGPHDPSRNELPRSRNFWTLPDGVRGKSSTS